MKKGIIIMAVTAMFMGCTPLAEEINVNLIENWNGGGVTGTGSEPTNFNWASSYVSASWQTANSTTSGTVRYVDVTATSSPVHTYNGNTFTGRILMYRWDGLYWSSILTKGPITLDANTTYVFTCKYEWWSNGNAPTYNVAIGTAIDGTANIANTDFIASTTKNQLIDGTLSFTTTSAGSYYLIITQKSGTATGNGTLIGLADLSLKKE